MAAKAKGEVLTREWKAGRGYALRFMAYGKREYLTLGLERDGWTHERAAEEMENIMADVRRGTWVAPNRKHGPSLVPEADAPPREGAATLFLTFADELLERRRGQMGDSHLTYLEWGLAHLRPFFAGWALAEIDAEAIDSYSAAKVKEGQALARAISRGKPQRDERGRARRPLSASSINKTIDVLAWALSFAVEYKRYGLAENPAQGKRRRLVEPQRRPVYLDTTEQIEALLDGAEALDRDLRFKGSERKAIVATFVLAGPRASELGHLLWRDVDLANGRIFIGRSKTQAGLREITMVPILRDILAAHKAGARRTGPENLVFSTDRNTRRNKDNLRARLTLVFKRADELLSARDRVPLPVGLTPHKLRHTFTSILIAIGEDPSSVMAQLGHTDPKFTLKVYTHMMARSPDERARLKALIAGDREGHRLTPRRLGWHAFEAPILRALAKRGGRSTRRAVLAALAVEMEQRFSEADLVPYRGSPRWQVDADLARRHLLKRGLLRKTRGAGFWALSEAGAARALPSPALGSTALDRDRRAENDAVLSSQDFGR